MRLRVFTRRNLKELLRDPLTLLFGLAFPLVVLLLLSLIQANIPVSLFEIDSLTPGIAVFGLSFVSLLSGLLISRDRTSSFLMRLFSSPMTSADFILSYCLPMLLLAITQSVVCFLAAFLLGLAPSVRVLLCLLALLPADVLFIALGLLVGSLLNDKQVGSFCGALLTNLTAWLSGVWFDISLMGGVFETIARLLPFVHAVEAARAALSGNYSAMALPLLVVSGYALLLFALAVYCFRRKMRAA